MVFSANFSIRALTIVNCGENIFSEKVMPWKIQSVFGQVLADECQLHPPAHLRPSFPYIPKTLAMAVLINCAIFQAVDKMHFSVLQYSKTKFIFSICAKREHSRITIQLGNAIFFSLLPRKMPTICCHFPTCAVLFSGFLEKN